jgi:hypothetical protein
LKPPVSLIFPITANIVGGAGNELSQELVLKFKQLPASSLFDKAEKLL